jgi:hypothetical protein
MSWFGRQPSKTVPSSCFYLGVIPPKAEACRRMAERKMTPAQITEAQEFARDRKPATQPPPR